MPTAVEQATTELRNLIVRGTLPVGEKITESSGAQILGLSRTPLREALAILEREGLLEKLSGRGYTVRQISLDDMKQAAQLRGVIEGFAAGQLALKGVSQKARHTIEMSLSMSETVISKAALNDTDIGLYHQANSLFHGVIAQECDNGFVASALEKVRQIPIVTPGAFNKLGAGQANEKLRLTVGHSQHVLILDAITDRDQIRAENMMREHAHAPIRYAELFLGDDVQKVLPVNFRNHVA